MAPPAKNTSLRRKKKQNHKFMVKVLVTQEVPASICAMESYQEWMRTTIMMKKKTRKGRKLELSDFPDDLMESILERLSSSDRIRFGATCKKYLSFVTNEQHQYQFRTIDKLPWLANLLLSSPDDLVFSLFEPLQQLGQPNYADYQICDPKGEGLGCVCYTTIKACKKGWFLCLYPNKQELGMACFLLFCPFNKRIIKLPDLGHHLDIGDQISCRATFSSDDPSSPHCVFFFLSQEENGTPEKYRISTLLDQKSGKWKTKLYDKLISYVSSVVYHDGCFFCLSILGELAAYNVAQQTWNLIIAPSPPLSNLRSGMHFTELYSYLFVCEGKLIFAFAYKPPTVDNYVDMVRCGLFEFSSSTSTWIEKTSLGDHALFLGNPTSFSVHVPSWSDDVADRIYFYSFMMAGEDCSIYYSLKDSRCHLFEDGDYWSCDVKCGMWIEPPYLF